MTFDGTDIKDFGMVPYRVQGAYSMPARLGDWFYNWGDTIEPLFGANYTAWQPRTFTVDIAFDTRYQTIGNAGTTVESWLAGYAANPDIALVFNGGTGSIGQHTVKMVSAGNHKKYRGAKETFSVVLQENAPAFAGTIPLTSSDVVTIDGRGLNAFSCVLSRFSVSGLGVAPFSAETVYMAAQKLRSGRLPQTVSLEVVCNDDPLNNMAHFHKLLSQDKVLPVVYGSINFDAVCVSGFNPKPYRNGCRFTLNLERL